MALRPTDLQVIMTATRAIESLQEVAQQQARAQQEHLISRFQREIEERKSQTEAAAKAEQSQVRQIDSEGKEQGSGGRKRKKQSQEEDGRTDSGKSDHIIDFLI